MAVLHKIQIGVDDKGEAVYAERQLSPLQAIKWRCLDCSGWSRNEVRLCPATTCANYPFRFGKNPGRVKRQLSEEQRAAAAERLRRAREARGR